MGRARKDNRHLPAGVTIINGTFYFKAPGVEDAKRERMVGPDGESIRDNEEHLMYSWLAKRTEPKPMSEVTTLAEVFNRYVREILPQHAPRTQKDYLKHFVVLRKAFGHMQPDELRPRDVGRFLDVPRGKILRNRQAGVLSAVYGYAVGRWYVAERNPCAGVKRNEARKRDRYITDAEYAALYALHGPRMQVAMDLALLTGQRQGDLIGLTWEAVTEEGVLFRQGKTGKRLLVAMSPTLRAVLERARKLKPDIPREYVLRTRKGDPYTGEGFRAIWQRKMRKALKLGALASRFTFHDVRAKSVSDSATIQEAFERAGHTSMAMTRGVYDRGVRKVTPLK